jgi:hypothetical protein
VLWSITIQQEELLMSHLVEPFREIISLTECRDRVQIAHGYLVRQAKAALATISDAAHVDDWGAFMKRVRVLLPPECKPGDIPTELTDHSFTEVYNQCATMERLLDALEWLINHPKLSRCRVLRCHPTTSSAPAEEADNDLMLINEQDRLCACFEVSDVVSSTRDSNQKERKDLVSLGVLRKAKKVAAMVDGVDWPNERQLFLIVSQEFADYLRRPARHWLHEDSGPYCRYDEVKPEGATRIFLVEQGNS